jgi:hypothetical protein
MKPCQTQNLKKSKQMPPNKSLDEVKNKNMKQSKLVKKPIFLLLTFFAATENLGFHITS